MIITITCRRLKWIVLSFYFVCLSAAKPTDATFLDWFWKNGEDVAKPSVKGPLIQIPFESQPDDEKFLEEATKFTELMKSSALDQCQHKVVLSIKTSCSAMTEEDLAKMSVNLLNCQSAVDGRQIFPCTEVMSLKQCTVNMDPNMWNAYHMMNNRARAVCLASRKAQFQALSEMTVNKLMSTAHEQINRMNSLLEGQERLETLTSDTLSSVEKGQVTLMLQQDKLRTTQQGIQDFISHNLQELTREKALIAAGHKELATMTERMKEKLDEANQQLIIQSLERSGNHAQLIEDIEEIQRQADKIFKKIDASTEKLLAQHKAAADQYEETLQNLKTINITVEYLMQLVNTTRKEIDERFYWIQEFLGGTGDQIDKISSVVSHIVYLLVGMLFSSFLNISTFPRATLALLVPLNLFITYTQGQSKALDLCQMTILIGIFIFVNAIVQAVIRYVSPPKPQVLYLKDSVVRSMKLDREEYTNEKEECDGTDVVRKKSKISSLKLSSVVGACKSALSGATEFLSEVMYGKSSKPRKPMDARHDETVVSSTLTEDREPPERQRNWHASTPVLPRNDQFASHSLVSEWLQSKVDYVSPPLSSSSRRSGSPKINCSALTRTGKRCRNGAVTGREFCHRHMTGTSIAS